MSDYIFQDETFAIRGAIYEVYATLGAGYLEDVYQNALEEELKQRRIPFVAKPSLHISYKGRDCGLYMPDIICYDKIILELKSVETLHPRHIAQLLNYLKATNLRMGLLVNFNSSPRVEIHRYVV